MEAACAVLGQHGAVVELAGADQPALVGQERDEGPLNCASGSATRRTGSCERAGVLPQAIEGKSQARAGALLVDPVSVCGRRRRVLLRMRALRGRPLVRAA